MAKDRSFIAKIAKALAQDGAGDSCPECGETYDRVQLVVSEQQKTTGAWKFNQRFLRVCKCNQEEVYG